MYVVYVWFSWSGFQRGPGDSEPERGWGVDSVNGLPGWDSSSPASPCYLPAVHHTQEWSLSVSLALSRPPSLSLSLSLALYDPLPLHISIIRLLMSCLSGPPVAGPMPLICSAALSGLLLSYTAARVRPIQSVPHHYWTLNPGMPGHVCMCRACVRCVGSFLCVSLCPRIRGLFFMRSCIDLCLWV